MNSGNVSVLNILVMLMLTLLWVSKLFGLYVRKGVKWDRVGVTHVSVVALLPCKCFMHEHLWCILELSAFVYLCFLQWFVCLLCCVVWMFVLISACHLDMLFLVHDLIFTFIVLHMMVHLFIVFMMDHILNVLAVLLTSFVRKLKSQSQNNLHRNLLPRPSP
jgi:hypothetical protein